MLLWVEIDLDISIYMIVIYIYTHGDFLTPTELAGNTFPVSNTAFGTYM